MTTPIKAKAFIAALKKPWWWSPHPPWRYRTADGRGWHDPASKIHPGLFNLMWVTSGIGTETDVSNFADKVWWAITDGDQVKLNAYTLADHAMTLTLPEFDELLRHHRRELAKKQFNSNMTAAKLMLLVSERRKTCA